MLDQRAHDLAILYLKSKDTSNFSVKQFCKKYNSIFEEIKQELQNINNDDSSDFLRDNDFHR